jgi:integrase/recombinase XerD
MNPLIHTEILKPGSSDLMTSINPSVTYENAISLKKELQWRNLSSITVHEALDIWVKDLSTHTRTNYISGMRKLAERSFINPLSSLQQFALVNHNAVLIKIRTEQGWAQCTRQARAACYISFTRYLSWMTEGVFPRAVPCKDEMYKTFEKVRDKVDTDAMTQAQWAIFLNALESLNPRDCLIAKVILQGGKRVNEVLSLKCDQIHWDKNTITFAQSKTKGVKRDTIITYPISIMYALKGYLNGRAGLVFITRNGKPIPRLQLANTFAKAGKLAAIPFKVTPHVLRASTVTYLRQQGFTDSDIQKVTGHASFEMISAYDKSSIADNASKKVSLVM